VPWPAQGMPIFTTCSERQEAALLEEVVVADVAEEVEVVAVEADDE
jgi:hypothetical protein